MLYFLSTLEFLILLIFYINFLICQGLIYYFSKLVTFVICSQTRDNSTGGSVPDRKEAYRPMSGCLIFRNAVDDEVLPVYEACPSGEIELRLNMPFLTSREQLRGNRQFTEILFRQDKMCFFSLHKTGIINGISRESISARISR